VTAERLTPQAANLPFRLLRAAEVADVLGISRSKAYLMAASGQLPSVRLGRSLRVPLDRLQQWIASQVTGGEVQP